MSQHEDWSPEQERDVYTAQAIVEALSEYEAAHPMSAPCLNDALHCAMQVMHP